MLCVLLNGPAGSLKKMSLAFQHQQCFSEDEKKNTAIGRVGCMVASRSMEQSLI